MLIILYFQKPSDYTGDGADANEAGIHLIGRLHLHASLKEREQSQLMKVFDIARRK